MTTELPMTDARLGALRDVAAGRVTYDAQAGYWHVDSERVVGWAGRTLAGLRRHGYIETTLSDQSPYTVDLTERGKEALA